MTVVNFWKTEVLNPSTTRFLAVSHSTVVEPVYSYNCSIRKILGQHDNSSYCVIIVVT